MILSVTQKWRQNIVRSENTQFNVGQMKSENVSTLRNLSCLATNKRKRQTTGGTQTDRAEDRDTGRLTSLGQSVTPISGNTVAPPAFTSVI